MYADDTSFIIHGNNLTTIKNPSNLFRAQNWVLDNHLVCNNVKTASIRFNYANSLIKQSTVK